MSMCRFTRAMQLFVVLAAAVLAATSIRAQTSLFVYNAYVYGDYTYGGAYTHHLTSRLDAEFGAVNISVGNSLTNLGVSPSSS